MNTILAVGIFQILMVAYLIYANANKHSSTAFLYMVLGVGLLHLGIKSYLYFVLQDEDLFNKLFTGFAYGYGLMIYLYVLRFYNLKYSRKRVFYFHLLPFLIILLLNAVFVVEVLGFHHEEWLPTYGLLFRYPVVILSNFYTLLAVYKLRQAYLQYPNARTSVRQVTWAILAPLAVTLLILISGFFYEELMSPTAVRLSFYSSLIVMFVVLLQHHLKYQPIADLTDDAVSNRKEKKVYANSGLENGELALGANQLQELMLSKKAYLDAELTLDKLSTLSGLPKHHISEILNDHLEQNFYTYVNRYRVEEARVKLLKDINESIMDVAYACGFKSKTSFNTYFKKLTGLTPTEYRSSNTPNLTA